MVRVVLDTNIIVSGILSATGASRAILELARQGRVEIISSPVLLEELEDVLSRFMSRSAGAEIRNAIEELTYLVKPEIIPAVARDPDDEHVPAAAIAGHAIYIVTRDRDLLTLGSHEDIRILEPAPALAELRSADAAEGD